MLHVHHSLRVTFVDPTISEEYLLDTLAALCEAAVLSEVH